MAVAATYAGSFQPFLGVPGFANVRSDAGVQLIGGVPLANAQIEAGLAGQALAAKGAIKQQRIQSDAFRDVNRYPYELTRPMSFSDKLVALGGLAGGVGGESSQADAETRLLGARYINEAGGGDVLGEFNRSIGGWQDADTRYSGFENVAGANALLRSGLAAVDPSQARSNLTVPSGQGMPSTSLPAASAPALSTGLPAAPPRTVNDLRALVDWRAKNGYALSN